ncbi:ubiquitin carboxyl-terminal hydrolase 15 isoform X2 [Folsomia candida]|uniref:ubiquitin carboxyl-terminal hydrolase 15 isoform X2 n=1 Tax=Folsomia candida TaxID=158441 RepID=UPI0016054021|nr:ubiquitin carboxyl-terminal hydrolase 15 isoform X2 [Folsomia candida]
MGKTRLPRPDNFVPATVGLPNEENTVWLNVIAQCLCNADPFVKYFLANEHLTDLRKKYWIPLGKGKVGPQWEGDNLHDAFEFCCWLLDHLNEELNLRASKEMYRVLQFSKDKSAQVEAETIAYHLSRNKSIIQDCFIGFLGSSLTCSGCNKEVMTFDPCLGLGLPIPIPDDNPDGSVSLADCFNSYTAPEQLNLEDSWHCVRCQKKISGTVKQVKIWTTPQILVIVLKRFSKRVAHSPLGKQVDFPIEGLDLSPWVKSPRNEGNIYDLFGVVTYFQDDSTSDSGYNEAYCKNPVDHAWRKFSDEMVEFVESDAFSSNDDIRKEAYILFYGRRGSAD